MTSGLPPDGDTGSGRAGERRPLWLLRVPAELREWIAREFAFYRTDPVSSPQHRRCRRSSSAIAPALPSTESKESPCIGSQSRNQSPDHQITRSPDHQITESLNMDIRIARARDHDLAEVLTQRRNTLRSIAMLAPHTQFLSPASTRARYTAGLRVSAIQCGPLNACARWHTLTSKRRR
jgi:hypothetical protein